MFASSKTCAGFGGHEIKGRVLVTPVDMSAMPACGTSLRPHSGCCLNNNTKYTNQTKVGRSGGPENGLMLIFWEWVSGGGC